MAEDVLRKGSLDRGRGEVYSVCFITIPSSVNRTAGNRKDKNLQPSVQYGDRLGPVVADSVQCGNRLGPVLAYGF